MNIMVSLKLNRLILVFLVFLPVIVIAIGGTLLVPELEKPDQIISKVLVIVGSGTPWFIALFIVAAFAAAMSTADSQLLVLGSIFARDIYRNLYKKDASDKDQKKATHVVIVIMALCAFIMAWKPPSFIVQLSILSISATLQLAPAYLVMLFGPRMSAWWPIASISAGLFVLLGWQFIIGAKLPFGIHPSILGLFFSGSIMLIGCILAYKNKTKPFVEIEEK